jgi:hypothetical protein
VSTPADPSAPDARPERAAPEPFEVRAYRPGDEHRILETFNRVFAAVDPGFRPRTLAEWRWLFADNPAGWRSALAVTADGRVVGQYAGICQRVRVGERVESFSQSVDSMADPAYRRLRRESPFMRCGTFYIEQYSGRGEGQDRVMWGLPIPVAWRFGRSFFMYEMVRTQTKLVGSERTWRLPAAPGVEVVERSACPEDVGSLFERAAAPYAAIALRDRAYLNWRFDTNPLHRYRLAEARRGGELVGLAYWRPGHFDGGDDGLVAEWLVVPDDDGARAALLAWMRELGTEAGLERTVALLPDSAACWLPLQRMGMRVHPTRYFLVAYDHGPGHDVRWLYHGWYHTLGDTDLV